MSECTHDCSSCGESCADRQGGSPFQIKPLHEGCHVRKVYGVVSGKGGVGKSMVTSQLAVTMQRRGHRTAILDADVTGPSIPKCFGIHGRAVGSEDAILPVQTETGIQLMSVNLLLEHETDPVIWRGPVIGGVVQQFWGDVLWQDVDYMFVDMPPGTGDVALNVFQTLPVDGVIIVTSPQDLVGMVVEKAVKMAQMMNIPIVGLVENMSYLACPDCGRKIYLFGEGKTQEAADRYSLPLLAQMPIDPTLAALVAAGRIGVLTRTASFQECLRPQGFRRSFLIPQKPEALLTEGPRSFILRLFHVDICGDIADALIGVGVRHGEEMHAVLPVVGQIRDRQPLPLQHIDAVGVLGIRPGGQHAGLAVQGVVPLPVKHQIGAGSGAQPLAEVGARQRLAPQTHAQHHQQSHDQAQSGCQCSPEVLRLSLHRRSRSFVPFGFPLLERPTPIEYHTALPLSRNFTCFIANFYGNNYLFS